MLISSCRAHRHGTRSAYDHHGCRCPQAREQVRLYKKRRRHGRQPPGLVDPTGTRRKMQALMAIGWTRHELARRMGCKDRDTITALLAATRIQRGTAVRAATVYQQLSMTPGPSAITQGRARNAGYLPPLAWDDIDNDPTPPTAPASSELDESAVLRAMAGHPPANLRPVERRAAVARLAAMGLSVAGIACRLNTSVRTITRYQRDHRPTNETVTPTTQKPTRRKES